MQKLLIINFRKNGDLFALSHLLHSLKSEYPQIEIGLLLYKEFMPSAQLLKNISVFYTLDRQEIVTYKKGKIFSEAHGINLFCSVIEEIKSFQWDGVVNLSYDLLSTYILSYLNPSYFIGVRCLENGSFSYSNIWSLIFNEVVPKYPFTPIHYIDCFHEMMEIPFVDEEMKIISNPHNNKKVADNITQLKKEIGLTKKMVGIKIKTANSARDLPLPFLIDFLKILFKSNDFYPLLLVAPSVEEKEVVNHLNRHFDNQLLAIECDFIGLSSVLLNIDLLITPDTAIKHMADCLKTPVIEISLDKAPMRKQGDYQADSLILRSPSGVVEASDLFAVMQFWEGQRKKEELHLSEQVTLYRAKRDRKGIWYQALAGTISSHEEISYLISRYYLYQVIEKESLDEILTTVITEYDHDALYLWMDQQRKDITDIVNKLLPTLALLRSLKENPQRGRELVPYLESILAFCERPSLVALPCCLLRGELESMESHSTESNIRDMEKFLLQLKEHLHGLTMNLTHLTSLEYRYRKGELSLSL